MRTQSRQPITNEKLLEILAEEKSKSNGQLVYTDRVKTVIEMLRMRGVKF